MNSPVDIPNVIHVADRRVSATESTIGAQTKHGIIVADSNGWTIVYRPGKALRSHSERRMSACPMTNLQAAVHHLLNRGTPPDLPVAAVLAPGEDNPEVMIHRKAMQA